MRHIFFLVIFYLKISGVQAQEAERKDTSTIIKKRLIPVAVGIGVAYTASMIALNELWYKNNPRSSFHFFDDSGEWKQMDKLGHTLTAFHQSRFAVDVLRWSGLPEKKAVWIGSMAGIVFQMPIEILDGYSSSYGFSWSDVAANAAGSGMVLAQYLMWDELRMQPRFSFHRTPYAPLRPNVLGSNLQEEILKDYNGQTYWLSFNISSFIKKETRIPSWLNVSLGYSANEMVYAHEPKNRAHGYEAYRQYFFALDIDLSKIKTKSKAVNFLFTQVFNIIHIPGPAIELNRRQGIRLHPLYF